MFIYHTNTVTAFTSRRWILRNWEALEMYFSETRRHVSPLEIFLGAINTTIILRMFINKYTMFSGLPYHVLCSELIVAALFSVPYLSVCYLLCLLLGNVNSTLKNKLDSGSVRSFKQCCRLLESLDRLLNGVHDKLLVSAALLMVLLESMATISECGLTGNLITFITFALAPYTALVILADQTSDLMRKKRKRIRRRWTRGPPNFELLTLFGHRNAFGLRWLADSSNMNYVSAISMLNRVFVYASLILTTPTFLYAENRFDFFCPDECDGAEWFRELPL